MNEGNLLPELPQWLHSFLAVTPLSHLLVFLISTCGAVHAMLHLLSETSPKPVQVTKSNRVSRQVNVFEKALSQKSLLRPRDVCEDRSTASVSPVGSKPLLAMQCEMIKVPAEDCGGQTDASTNEVDAAACGVGEKPVPKSKDDILPSVATRSVIEEVNASFRGPARSTDSEDVLVKDAVHECASVISFDSLIHSY